LANGVRAPATTASGSHESGLLSVPAIGVAPG
jgi:hypothetical protein